MLDLEPITGWKRKLLLIFKSEKRLGAKKLVDSYQKTTFKEMKLNKVTAQTQIENYENKRVKDLYSHLEHLRHEFEGQSELCYYHATLIVLLRRNYKSNETFTKFMELWENETDYLLEHSSLRWLISACDTIIDYSNNPVRNAILMNAVTLVNTLRICETQLYLICKNETDKTKLLDEKIQLQYDQQWQLYDGLTYFRAGGDDTLSNMRKRYESFYAQDTFATKILIKVFKRLHTHNNAFSIMKELQISDRANWWQEDN